MEDMIKEEAMEQNYCEPAEEAVEMTGTDETSSVSGGLLVLGGALIGAGLYKLGEKLSQTEAAQNAMAKAAEKKANRAAKAAEKKEAAKQKKLAKLQSKIDHLEERKVKDA